MWFVCKDLDIFIMILYNILQANVNKLCVSITIYFYIDAMFNATCHFSRAFEVNRIAMFVATKNKWPGNVKYHSLLVSLCMFLVEGEIAVIEGKPEKEEVSYFGAN